MFKSVAVSRMSGNEDSVQLFSSSFSFFNFLSYKTVAEVRNSRTAALARASPELTEYRKKNTS